MTSWQIEPAEVAAVLGKVQPEIQALNEATDEGHISALMTAVATCNNLIPTDCVEAAMIVFLQDQMGQVGQINNDLAAGMVGVSTAVGAYQQGNAEMATEANRQMWTSADSGDFTWFIENPLSTRNQPVHGDQP